MTNIVFTKAIYSYEEMGAICNDHWDQFFAPIDSTIWEPRSRVFLVCAPIDNYSEMMMWTESELGDEARCYWCSTENEVWGLLHPHSAVPWLLRWA